MLVKYDPNTKKVIDEVEWDDELVYKIGYGHTLIDGYYWTCTTCDNETRPVNKLDDVEWRVLDMGRLDEFFINEFGQVYNQWRRRFLCFSFKTNVRCITLYGKKYSVDRLLIQTFLPDKVSPFKRYRVIHRNKHNFHYSHLDVVELQK